MPSSSSRAKGSSRFSPSRSSSPTFARPAAALFAGIIGVVVGFPALRIKGIYLLLLTLGFGEIVSVIALSWDYVGGAQGYRNIPFNPRTLDQIGRAHV